MSNSVARETIRRLKRGICVVTLMGEASRHAQFSTYKRGLVTALQKRGYPAYNDRLVLYALWELVSEGLMFIDFTRGHEQPDNRTGAPEDWIWVLTVRGERLARSSGDDVEPDDPEGYLSLLQRRIPHVDGLIMTYVEEAVRAYRGRCYLASTVMLGVASERAFQILGDAFKQWLPERKQNRLLKHSTTLNATILTSLRNSGGGLNPRRDRFRQNSPTTCRSISTR